jgi:hypothetical protein
MTNKGTGNSSSYKGNGKSNDKGNGKNNGGGSSLRSE